MAEQKNPEALQRLRAVAHMKFKRKVKCLQSQIDKENSIECLHRCFDELNKAYEQLEQAHESYLENLCLTADLENEESFMDDADSIKISITTAYDKALSKCDQDIVAGMKKIKLMSEDPQYSSGEKQASPSDCQQENCPQNNINMNNLQECNICCEVYNDDDHRPLVLPCGHTLCKTCINNVTSEGWTTTIHCPTCRTYHNINPNQLTTNYAVLDLLKLTGSSVQQNIESSAPLMLKSKINYSKSEENHKVEIEKETKGKSSTKPDGKSTSKSSILKKVGIGMGFVAGGAAAVAAAPVVLTGVGFTSAGIAAGSWAASMMSAAAVANGGAIAAGSTVAILQSAGAVGLGAGLTAGVAAGGAAVGGGIAAGVTKLTGRNTNDTNNEDKE